MTELPADQAERLRRLAESRQRRSGGAAASQPAAVSAVIPLPSAGPPPRPSVRRSGHAHRAAAARILAFGFSTTAMLGIVAGMSLSHPPTTLTTESTPAPVVQIIVRHHPAAPAPVQNPAAAGASPPKPGTRVRSAVSGAPAGAGRPTGTPTAPAVARPLTAGAARSAATAPNPPPTTAPPVVSGASHP